MTIKLEREKAKELITFKLQHIHETIRSILEKWGIDNTDDFLAMAKSGELENAEMDAITVRQLVADHQQLKILLESVKNEDSK
ncbi:hypothetical protein EU523_00840 [Candidatus Heimdallarchaeota archaeon]|nr:MAG: hypothetical protein EU523_00840 [Candidatus Heimdallarchaeota archaeon]